ncbi:MAG: hypothetical protein MJY50_01965 [Bacteroidales bacterium]|nr:hypothetical protein [Bacteroidales bacterium]
MLLTTVLTALSLLTINPVIQMTAITGRPTRSDVTQMLCDYHEVGIRQFLIYPRSGLEIEYMSEEWFRLCRDCIEVADSLGMKVWLYDEFNWPSGRCNGQVTADGNEDCYPKVLYFDRREDGGYDTRVELNRANADILDPKAVSRFINLTHERYYAEFGKYFGNVIPAIFTDEILGYSTIPDNRDHFGITWYDGLEADYAEACGRDLHSDVEAFLDGRSYGQLWADYYTVYGERMRHTYVEALADWCDRHGIRLTGHLMYEKLYKGARCNGNNLKMLSAFGIPGFDEANSDLDINAREMEISGLALVQYASRGKSDAMCEMYSVGPADLTLSHQRQLMWLCSAFGVNNYIMAVAAMDARGNKDKGDWYFQSGRTQPWFDYYRQICPEAERAASFARKPYTPKVLVRVPSRYFASLDKTPAFEEEGRSYLRFLEALMSHQIQFALLDEDEAASPGTPVLSFGKEGFFIEGQDGRYRDQEEYMARITSVEPREVVVSCDGEETRDVFVRRFDDGSVVLVDMTDKDRTDRLLSVITPEGEGHVRLPGHGAFAGTFADMDQTLPAGQISDLTDRVTRTVTMSLDGPNLVRCLHTRESPRFSFTLTSRLDGIRFFIRSEVDPCKVRLDGEELSLTDRCAELPQGFASLYRTTEPLSLQPGAHTLEFAGEDVDMRYLPTAFIAGEFAYDRASHTLGPWTGGYSSTATAAPDYVGTYDMELRLRCGGGDIIRLDTNLACTELFLDGKSLGRRAWGPYEWTVPADCRHKRHTLTVRISNSIMPMFGDIPALDNDQPYLDWLRIKPGMHGDKSTTGIVRFDLLSTIFQQY